MERADSGAGWTSAALGDATSANCPQPERLTCFRRCTCSLSSPDRCVKSESLGTDLQGEASLPRSGLLNLGIGREELEDLNVCHWETQLLTASPLGLPWWLSGIESAGDAGDVGSIPWV